MKMTPEDIRTRYVRAREQAIRAIDDLDQGADPERVYDELEIAFLWKMSDEGSGMRYRPDTLSRMLERTND